MFFNSESIPLSLYVSLLRYLDWDTLGLSKLRSSHNAKSVLLFPTNLQSDINEQILLDKVFHYPLIQDSISGQYTHAVPSLLHLLTVRVLLGAHEQGAKIGFQA